MNLSVWRSWHLYNPYSASTIQDFYLYRIFPLLYCLSYWVSLSFSKLWLEEKICKGGGGGRRSRGKVIPPPHPPSFSNNQKDVDDRQDAFDWADGRKYSTAAIEDMRKGFECIVDDGKVDNS